MSKSSDQVVLERRLKPIYDAIDSGNNKKAMQEAEKVLKKHPNTHCAKVLKGLALIRSDRVTDAWPLIEEVESEKDDLDENTLQALCHCFKEAFTPERICALYERVCSRHPKNEQYLTHLFMSYVRVRNYKMQQKTALLLYKEFQRNPYYFWHVMSIVMQAITGDTKLAKTMFYPLAEKMVRKMIDSNSIQAEAECDLYTIVLEGLNKFEEAANFLETDLLYRRFMQQPEQFVFYRILGLHFRAGNYLLVVERCMSRLKNAADDWNLWSHLFNAAFAHMKLELCSFEEKDALIARLVDRVLSLIDKTEGLNLKIRLRGPYIARLSLIEKLLESELTLRTQLGTLSLGEPMDHIVEFVQFFHDKPCCFTDIRPFLNLLGEEQIEPFLEKIQQMVLNVRKTKDCVEESDVVPDAVKWVDILHHRLQRTLGRHVGMPPNDKRRLSGDMIRKVQHCEDSGLAAAAYAQISAHLLWDLWTECGDVTALYEMILLLEWVYSRHRSDQLCRLVLCRAYALIGCTAQVQRLMQSLDIKYVQRETLGYLLFGLLEQYGRFNAGIIYYTELSVLSDQTEKEVSECLTTAYKNGNFLQIPRLVSFLSDLSGSTVAIGADVQSRLLSSCFAVDKIQHIVDTMYGDEEAIDFEKARDNRDLYVIPSLNPGNFRKEIEEVRKCSFHEQVDALQLRHLLLKCMASVARENISASKMNTFLTQLKKHYDHCKMMYKETDPPLKLLQAPPPLYLNSFVHGSHIEVVEVLVTSAIDLVQYKEDIEVSKQTVNEEKLCQRLPDADTFGELLCRAIEGQSAAKGLFGLHPLLRDFSNALQTLALASIAIKLIEMILERILAICTNSVTKGKKSNAPKNQRKSLPFSRVDELHGQLKNGARIIDSKLADGQKMLNSDDLIPDISPDNDDDVSQILLSQKATVDSAIVTSYSQSLNDMRETLLRVISPPWA